MYSNFDVLNSYHLKRLGKWSFSFHIFPTSEQMAGNLPAVLPAASDGILDIREYGSVDFFSNTEQNTLSKETVFCE